MAEILIYVDPDAVGGGTGVDWANAYISLNAAEAAEETDLVTDTDNIIFNCRASSGTADTTGVIFNGWTTGSSNDIKILGDLSTGIWDTSKYRLNDNTSGNVLEIIEEYVTSEKLQVENPGSGNAVKISYSGASNLSVTDDCLFRTEGVAGYILSNSNIIAEITNTIAYNTAETHPANSVGIYADLCTSLDVLNCTVYNQNDGIERDEGAVNVINTTVFFCDDDFDGTFNSIDHCASDDGDGTNAVTITQSASDYAALVTDAPNGDFTVTDASSELYNAGTNTGAPGDDIIGTSRPQDTTTDIGAFEFIVAGDIVLIIPGTTQAQAIDNLSLTQANILVINDVGQSQTIEILDLIQANLLAINSIDQSQTIETLDLVQANVLAINDIDQSQNIDNITLNVASILDIADMIQNQNIDVVNLIQQNILDANDLAQGQALDQITLDAEIILGIADIVQVQAVDNIDLTQANILEIDGLTQAQNIDNVTISIFEGKIIITFNLKKPETVMAIKKSDTSIEIKKPNINLIIE